MGEKEETTDFTDRHGSRFAQGLRQDRLALNLDHYPDRDLDHYPDRKINDLVMEWNMDAQDGQDFGLGINLGFHGWARMGRLTADGADQHR